MSRWEPAQPYIESKRKNGRDVWVAAIHYIQNNEAKWFNKIELYGSSREEVEQLQSELLGFLQTQEMCGVFHG